MSGIKCVRWVRSTEDTIENADLLFKSKLEPT